MEKEQIQKHDVSSRLFAALFILTLGIIGGMIVQIFLGFKNLPENYPREITVEAQGKTFAKPDIALVKIGVETKGMEVDKVIKENTEKMNSVLEEIKKLGIEEKDIQTIQYSLSPQYDYLEKGERIFRGYLLTNQIQVKIRNFEKIGEVLTKATEKGANLVGDLRLIVEEPEKLLEIARKEAIEKAKTKANQIANQTGLKLVKLINIYEESYYPTPHYYKEIDLGPPEKREITAIPQIQPGEQELTVTVTLVYRVK